MKANVILHLPREAILKHNVGIELNSQRKFFHYKSIDFPSKFHQQCTAPSGYLCAQIHFPVDERKRKNTLLGHFSKLQSNTHGVPKIITFQM